MAIFIEGRLVYERDKDYRLKELLTGEEKIGGDEEKDADREGADLEGKE